MERCIVNIKKFKMLCILLQNQGIVLTRDQLLNKETNGDTARFDGESRTVDVHIRTLTEIRRSSREAIQNNSRRGLQDLILYNCNEHIQCFIINRGLSIIPIWNECYGRSPREKSEQ